MTRHRSMIHARCPHGPWDYYEVLVEPVAFLTVEDMERTLDGFRGATAYQEDLTRDIAAKFGPKVTTRGRHGTVDTEVTA